VTLELGGKSAAIILDDADLDAVAQGIPMACMLNNGQACYNGTRILAPARRYKQVVDAVAATVASFKVGDPLDRATNIGPMASATHRDRVETYIAKGKAEGRLVTGGGRPKGLDRGWFVEPTVFADVANSAVIAQEEIFGPVLSVISYEDDADAIRIANDSAFGLGGSVWSADGERARAVARRVQTGTIGINGYMPSLGSPFGGVKASGMGSEFGPEAVASYQKLKSIYVMQ
jgi:geranial dehydrogenase